MSRTFRVFLDSGANIHSKYETETSLEDLGITSDEWDAMTDSEKDEAMRDVAFGQSEWGFQEIQGAK